MTKEDDQILVGQNVLGRQLCLLRDLLKRHGHEVMRMVPPPAIPDFLLYGEPIRIVEGKVDPGARSSML